MSGLEQLAEETLVQVAGIAISKAIDKFTEANPAAAEKAALGKDVLQKGLSLLSDDDLYAFLTSGDAAAAEIAYRLARAAKFGR